jgi:hypothetical protein
MRESNIQNSICEYLSYKKHFFWRNNTTGVFDPVRKTFRSKPKYALNGVPDIIVIRDGFFIGLEVKKAKTYQSKDQKEFERKCKDAGGEYYVVRSIKDVQDIGL